jgi:hypothetical protein
MLYLIMRMSYKSNTSGFQPEEVGAVPSIRSKNNEENI